MNAKARLGCRRLAAPPQSGCAKRGVCEVRVSGDSAVLLYTTLWARPLGQSLLAWVSWAEVWAGLNVVAILGQASGPIRGTDPSISFQRNFSNTNFHHSLKLKIKYLEWEGWMSEPAEEIWCS